MADNDDLIQKHVAGTLSDAIMNSPNGYGANLFAFESGPDPEAFRDWCMEGATGDAVDHGDLTEEEAAEAISRSWEVVEPLVDRAVKAYRAEFEATNSDWSAQGAGITAWDNAVDEYRVLAAMEAAIDVGAVDLNHPAAREVRDLTEKDGLTWEFSTWDAAKETVSKHYADPEAVSAAKFQLQVQATEPLRIDPAASSAERKAATQGIATDKLAVIVHATRDALAELQKRSDALSITDRQDRIQLDTGLKALQSEARSRGLKLEPMTVSNSQPRDRASHAAFKSRGGGIGD